MKPQFLVGAMMPGSGQTLVALGLMRALRQRNLRVQSFKCGPELADLRYHALAADREPVSLDTWLSSRSHLQTVYNCYGEKADVCVVEGRAGLFDGFRKTQGRPGRGPGRTQIQGDGLFGRFRAFGRIARCGRKHPRLGSVLLPWNMRRMAHLEP